jgi:RNA polymerase sigma-70 factor (ECF subfamily)
VTSDAELVRAALAGDREAFAALVRRYRRTACAAAAQVLGDRHAAQDAAQEAFLAAYRKLGTLRKPSAFGPWLLKIARRRATDMGRQTRATVSLASQADTPDPRSDGRLDETSRRLLSAVMGLPRQERVAVMLKYFDGRANQEIADITGRAVGTVSKQLTRAHERLRRRLKDVEL